MFLFFRVGQSFEELQIVEVERGSKTRDCCVFAYGFDYVFHAFCLKIKLLIELFPRSYYIIIYKVITGWGLQ